MWHEPPPLRITRGRRAGFRVDRRARAARTRRTQGHGFVSRQSVRVRKRQRDRDKARSRRHRLRSRAWHDSGDGRARDERHPPHHRRPCQLARPRAGERRRDRGAATRVRLVGGGHQQADVGRTSGRHAGRAHPQPRVARAATRDRAAGRAGAQGGHLRPPRRRAARDRARRRDGRAPRLAFAPAPPRPPSSHHPRPAPGRAVPPRARRPRRGGHRDTHHRDSAHAHGRSSARGHREPQRDRARDLRLGERGQHLLPDAEHERRRRPRAARQQSVRDRSGDRGVDGDARTAA